MPGGKTKLVLLIFLALVLTGAAVVAGVKFYQDNVKPDTEDAVASYNEGNYSEAIENSSSLLEDDGLSQEEQMRNIELIVAGLQQEGKLQEALQQSKQFYQGYDITSLNFYMISMQIANELDDSEYEKTMIEEAIAVYEPVDPEEDPMRDTVIQELKQRLNEL